jgi:uncharacterized protein (TIGR03118 family)
MSACRSSLLALIAATSFTLVACGGGGGSAGDMSTSTTTSTTLGTTGVSMNYTETALVSDLTTTPHTDPHLVDARGVAFNPQGFVWVTDTGTSNSTLYDGNGVPQTLVVSIPAGAAGAARPTGIVFSNKQSFKVSQNGVSAASVFLFAGEAGTLSGWSPTVNGTNAITAVDSGAAGAVYKGLALASRGGLDFLYAADFHRALVDMFDANFARVTTAGAFVDSAMPAGYAPFGIQAIGDLIYVAYARQDAAARNAVTGAGLGLIDTFDTAGNLVKRLVPAGGVLDAPWGMAMAPANFGPLSNALLVANAGDGRINAFNPATGASMGTVSTVDGKPIVIDGVHGIAFGNGLNAQPVNTLFFAAAPNGGTHGLYGRIDSH